MRKSSLELAVEAAEKINAQLKGQFKLPPSNLRKKLSIPLKPKPTQTILGGHLISPSAKKVPSSEQKPIYFTPEKLPEGIELLNSCSYVCFRCTYCDVKLTSEAILRRHIEGTEHLKKSLLKLNAGKKDLKHQQTVVTTPKSTVDENSTDISKPIIDKKDQGQQKPISPPKPTLYYYLADTSEPVIGLDFVAETQVPDAEPTFYCKLCEVQCDTNEIKEHVVGIRHCLMYLQMVEAKKIEEIRNQYKKKSERNQEILKFAAQVEKARGCGTVKLILPQMLNKESSKKAEYQRDNESKDSCGSLKRAIEEPSSSSRKKPAFSNDSSDFKSYDNTKYYSSSHHSDIKQSDEFQDKQLQKNNKKRNRWGGYSDSNTTSSAQVLSNMVDFSGITTNNVPSLKESHPSLTTNVARKTSLPKPQPKKPLYKPPRSFLLPSDIIKSLSVTRNKLPQLSTLQAVPYLQTLPQMISPSKTTTSQKRTQTTSAKDSKPVSSQRQLKNTAKLTSSQYQTNLNLLRKEEVLEMSHHRHHQSSPKPVTSPSASNKSRPDSVRTETKLFESQYNEKSDSERNAILSTPSQHKLKENITPPTSGPVNPARSTSEHFMTGLLNHSEVKGSSNTEIEALKHLTSFVVTDDDDAGNVMEVITSLTQAYLHYKTRALTRPVRELLFQSLNDGSDGLQIVLRHYGVNNMEPLGSFSDINNDITRCASNLLRQFSSNWVEEPDECLPHKPDDSLDEDNFPPNRETTIEESEMLPFSQNKDSNINNVDSSMTDNTSEFKQPFPHNWNKNKNNASIKSSRSGSFDGWNGKPLIRDSSNISDR